MSAIWNEFFYGMEEENIEKPIFKTEKTNIPKNYTVPEGLKTFLSSVKSEITDPRNQNPVKCNLPQDDLQALKELQHLQRDCQIVVKA